MEGPFWARYTNGRLRYYGTAQGGLTQGLWTSWHENGAKAIEAEYAHGQLCGSFRQWDAAGHLTHEGRHDASGEMDGVWTRYWPGGGVRTRWTMSHGHQEGSVATWYESGARKSEGQRVDGHPDGVWTFWDERGAVLRTCRYESGRLVEGTCDDPRPD